MIISVIHKDQGIPFVGAASSRDHLISRLEAAHSGLFINLVFADKQGRNKYCIAPAIQPF
jgi:hypothetical protein